jgi:hypothetical protein
MKSQQWGLLAIALAVLILGLVALGVPALTLIFAAIALSCPLMMLVMMGGHGGHGSHGAQDHTTRDHDQHSTADRR